MATDPVQLAADLIRCPSVTPEEGGALTLLAHVLSNAGFACTRIDRGDVCNLFARWGSGAAGRTFGFNGHTDVVPAGDPANWSVDPFAGEIRGGILYGRGASDMKSAVAAFAAAAIDFVGTARPEGSVVLAITGDEEGDAIHGTRSILDWMDANGERMDHCLVGEPTCPGELGDMMKIGRRGSLTALFTATGEQGHSAYPHRARNPVPAIARLAASLASRELDGGTRDFEPSTLAVTAIETGNPASNVIPASCRAVVNVRFNDAHSVECLESLMRREADAAARSSGVDLDLKIKQVSECFVTPRGMLTDLVAAAVEAETGRCPELSTSGGTSDARFIRHHCPVVEFGLVGRTMHQADECVEVDQIRRLKAIYGRILDGYFA